LFGVMMMVGHEHGTDTRRVSLNVRIDPDKFAVMENMRKVGSGFQTERNRSDVYNEMLGYGIQTYMLKSEVGDRDFERLWKLINRLNWKKVNLEKVEKFLQ